MASGSWNNNGITPAHHNIYTKSKVFNWLSASVISSMQAVTLRDITLYQDAVQINTTTSNEYFLCENRQNTGFNAALPGHGMLIYHVDGTYINNHVATNDINAGSHQGMFPMSAVATTANGVMIGSGVVSIAGCAWPGTGNKTTFNDATTPNSKSWAGANTSKAIVNISETAGIVDFCLVQCDPNLPSAFIASAISSDQIDLNWTAGAGNDPVLIAYGTSVNFGVPVNGTAYTAGDPVAGGGTVIYTGSGSAFSHTGLTSSTVYYYKIWAVTTGNVYTTGVLASAQTLCTPSTLPFTETFNGSSIPDCWSQIDHAGTGQVWQFGVSTGNFIPTLTGNYAYLNSDAYGSGSTQNVDLVSPTFDLTSFTGVTLQFDHYFQLYQAESATVSYSIDNGQNWTVIQTFTITTTNPAAFNQSISAVAEQAQVKFKWNYTGTWGYGWAIDNINITGTYIPTWSGLVSNDWNTPGNWTNNVVPGNTDNIIIPSTGVVNPAIISSIDVQCNNLDIKSGAALTIASDGSLTINGTLTNNAGTGGLLVKSSTMKTGSLIHTTADVSGTIERYLTNANWSSGTDGWHMLSSPVAPQPISPEFATEPYDFYCWYEPMNTWVNYRNNTSAPTWNTANGSPDFVPGKGYLASYDQDATKLFSGTINSTDISVSGLGISAGANRSWHLLGNPFSSALTWDASVAWNLTNIAAVAKIWNNANQSYSDFTASPASLIPATSGFMVEVTSETGSLTLPASKRTISAQPFLKSQEQRIMLIARNLDAGNAQESTILFREGSSNEFDPNSDGEFLPGYGPQFYSVAGTEKLSTNCLPGYTGETSIPFQFIANQGTNFSIEALQIQNFSDVVYLTDLKTGYSQNLTQNPLYKFSSDVTDEPNRFILSFSALGVPHLISDQLFTATYETGTLKVWASKPLAIFRVIDETGRTLSKSANMLSGKSSIKILLPKGIYILQAADKKSVGVQKLYSNGEQF